MPRPRIGVSGPDRGGFAAWFFTALSIRLAGGKPVRITPARGLPEAPLAGIVIGGGADVDPARYRQERVAREIHRELRRARSRRRALLNLLVSPLVYLLRRLSSVPTTGVDPARDDLEWCLLEHAEQCRLPVFGICRGAQLMNVFAGGTLHQDLAEFYEEAANPWTLLPRKRIEVDSGTRLATVIGSGGCSVNSLHRQAVGELGNGIVVAAHEQSGVIQAIEAPGRRFFIGVQWHPEYLLQKREQRRLFRALVAEAKRSMVGAREHPGRDLAVTQKGAQRVQQAQRG